MSLAIICEYNPFHKGHAYQIAEARRRFPGEPVICIMSGNFVQRGEPACADKWVRAEMALKAGADMVLELPTYFATAGAEDFARGAVKIARESGLVDKLVFSTEPGTEDLLEPVARCLAENPAAFEALIAESLPSAPSFAAAREKAMTLLLADRLPQITPEQITLLRSPNAILALEYLKQLFLADSSIAPVILTRQGAGYLDTDAEAGMPSARALRESLASGGDITDKLPAEVRAVWQDALDRKLAPVFPEQFSPILRFTLAQKSPEDLAKIPGIAEGLENRLYNESRHFSGWDDLLERIATKRYPTARLRRILLYEMLGITRERLAETGFAEGPLYIRVLGCRDAALLSALAQSAGLPVLTSLSHLPELSREAQQAIVDEIRFTDIYMSLVPNGNDRGLGFEYRGKLIINN